MSFKYPNRIPLRENSINRDFHPEFATFTKNPVTSGRPWHLDNPWVPGCEKKEIVDKKGSNKDIECARKLYARVHALSGMQPPKTRNKASLQDSSESEVKKKQTKGTSKVNKYPSPAQKSRPKKLKE